MLREAIFRIRHGFNPPACYGRGVPERLLALHTLDICTQRAQFVLNTLVTTIDVVDTIDNGSPGGLLFLSILVHQS